MPTPKLILGRADIVDFPLLNLQNLKVKIDTGAYTSAIHCHSIKEQDGKLHCVFNDLENEEPKTIVFKNYTLTDVKSSNGHKENRFKIKTEVIFFKKTYKINLTLSTRNDMRFPALIGRQFLQHKFVVDVNLINQSFNNNKYEYHYPIS